MDLAAGRSGRSSRMHSICINDASWLWFAPPVRKWLALVRKDERNFLAGTVVLQPSQELSYNSASQSSLGA